jgi:hypothetical protein
MKNLAEIFKKEYFPISLILILTFSRLIPHPPNFTPIIAVAILSGYFFKDIYLALAVLVASMLAADFFIGFYQNIYLIYFTLLLITFIFFKLSNKINIKNLFLFSVLGSFIFYLTTNFGVWALGSLYEKNLSGLLECYILAIPFFGNTLLSTLFFSYTSMLVYKSLIQYTKN